MGARFELAVGGDGDDRDGARAARGGDAGVRAGQRAEGEHGPVVDLKRRAWLVAGVQPGVVELAVDVAGEQAAPVASVIT
jgi:hypothetical protein